MRLSRDLLTRAIAYKLQEQAYGGLSKSILRKLERRNRDSARRAACARMVRSSG